MTNAMTELEKQLCQKLLELQAENLVVWMQLQRCQTEYNEQSATIQGLRVELITTVRERDEARKAILKCGNDQSFDWNVLGEIDKLEQLEQRAERAESEMRLQMRQADKATKERDDLRAKVAELEQPDAKPETNIGIAILALARAYGLPGDLRCQEIIERVIAMAPQQQPGEVLFEGVRWMHKDWEHLLRNGTLELCFLRHSKDEMNEIVVPLHLEIRKAGE